MSYSPQTRLVYIPVIDVPTIWVDLLHNGGRVKYVEGFFTVQGIIPDDTYDAKDAEAPVRPGAGPASGQGRAPGQTGAGTDARLGSGGAERWCGNTRPHPESAATTAA